MSLVLLTIAALAGLQICGRLHQSLYTGIIDSCGTGCRGGELLQLVAQDGSEERDGWTRSHRQLIPVLETHAASP
mgnify:FL=1